MDIKIKTFIREQKNLTLCTSVNDSPYCASCFYAYNESDNTLIFKSGKETKHIVNALVNDKVAGTIVPDISKLGIIKGIQFTGKFFVLKADKLDQAKSVYYKRNPLALASPGELWAVELTSVKMIDSTLGFGKKLVWEKPEIITTG
jgi:uncharacterized protein